MTKPSQWDLKTILIVLAFFGVTGIGSLAAFAQKLTGIMAGPAIQSAQEEGLAKAGAADSARMEALKAWMSANVVTRLNVLEITLSDMPGAKEAAKRRKAVEKNREEMFTRQTFVNLKGDRTP